MALKTTEAVALKTFNWSESSRTVIFFSRDYGRLALTDKGGRRINSRRGRLIPFSRLEITFYESKKESAGYISSISLIESFSLEGEGALGRLAYASAACELLFNLLSDSQAQTDLYRYFITLLMLLDKADRRSLPVIFLTFFIHLLSYLGYHPSLSSCPGCGLKSEKLAIDGNVYFSPERGGGICNACQRVGEYYIPIPKSGYNLLVQLQRASLTQAVRLSTGYRETTLLLEALIKFVAYQTDLKEKLKSLEFLEKLKDSDNTLNKKDSIENGQQKES
ncbi:MAG: DNA repair protein RecO [candidate division Zixibacteria bacterium]|nr:DNA repair protein RecO [candidate division Zixibacteria bacterium]